MSDTSFPTSSESASALPERTKAIVRERMLRRYKAWLDEVLNAEIPPHGLAPEILEELQVSGDAFEEGSLDIPDDLFKAWSTVTTLTEEIRLQGRAFKQLHDNMSVMPDVPDVGAIMDPLQGGLEKLQAQIDEKRVTEIKHNVFTQTLDTVLDIRDRLERGLHTALACLQTSPMPHVSMISKWWSRWGATQSSATASVERDAIEALIKGYRLGLERMDDYLSEWQVEPVTCQGQAFDPKCMEAVDLEERTDVAEGTVLDVYRTGYRWKQKVYRNAQVKVAKNNQGQEVPHE